MIDRLHPKDVPQWYDLVAQSRTNSFRRARTDLLVGLGGIGSAAYLGWASLFVLGAWGMSSAVGYGLNGVRARKEMRGVLQALDTLLDAAEALVDPEHSEAGEAAKVANPKSNTPIIKRGRRLPNTLDKAQLAHPAVAEDRWAQAWAQTRPAKRWKAGYFSGVEDEDVKLVLEHIQLTGATAPAE